MNKSRWLFEGWQIRLDEEAKSKQVLQIGVEVAKAFQQILVSILGLNLEPMVEPNPEKPDEPKYRWPKEGEFTPLIMAIARPDYLAAAMEKVSKLLPMEGTENGEPPQELATEEDLEFFDSLDVDQRKAFWNSTEMQQQLKQYVIPLNPDEQDAQKTAHVRPVGITDADRAELMRQRHETQPSKFKFQIDDGLNLDDDLADLEGL